MRPSSRLLSLLVMVQSLLLALGSFLAPAAVLSQPVTTLAISHVDAEDLPQVRAFVSVLDGNGQPLRGLTSGAFEVLEDGSPQKLEEAVAATEAMAIVLAIDTSGSMGEGQAGNLPIDHARRAAEAFVDYVKRANAGSGKELDQLAVISFNDRPVVRSGMSVDHNAAINAIRGLSAEKKWTALYDAAFEAIKLASGAPKGRRAIVLFTDGRDEGLGSAPGKPVPGSVVTFNDVIDSARRGGIPLYVVGLGDDRTINRQELGRMAALTGGRFEETTNPAELSRLFEHVAAQLKLQYRLTFTTRGATGDHTLQVRVRSDGASGTDSRAVRYPVRPPVVQIVRPANGASVRDEVEVVPGFGAYFQRPLVKVEYRASGKLIGTATVTPWSFVWDTSREGPGTYELEVQAHDAGGQVGTHKITLTVLPPTPRTPTPAATPAKPAVTAAATAAAVTAATPASDVATGPNSTILFPALAAVLIVGGAALALILMGRQTPLGGPAPNSTEPIRAEQPQSTRPISLDALATLTIVEGESSQGQEYPIGASARIGRDPQCDVLIADPSATVSRFHAEIRLEGNDFVIYDLDSTNGTWVNGQRVRRDRGVIVAEDNHIALGNRFVLRFRRSPTAAPTAGLPRFDQTSRM